jgi:4-hydroxy-3-methylbut-2-enyl diphosphate reductase
MKIIRAEHLGMCFGVRDAIDLARKHSASRPLTVLGDLVHNETVVAELQRRGVSIARHTGEVNTQAVMISAHGASQRTLSRVRERNLDVIEATCPLVHLAHRAIAALVAEGYHPVIIGKAGHVEVRGMTEDLAVFDVVLSEAEVGELTERPRFGVAAQTTQPIERVRQLVASLRDRFPNSEVRFVDTVCQPTKQRQHAAVELARRSDVVIVIGGAHSNNTHELVKTCERYCSRIHHVQAAEDLRYEWFGLEETVGITAGTSTPDATILAVERWLEELAWRRNEGVRVAALVDPSKDIPDLHSAHRLRARNGSRTTK